MFSLCVIACKKTIYSVYSLIFCAVERRIIIENWRPWCIRKNEHKQTRRDQDINQSGAEAWRTQGKIQCGNIKRGRKDNLDSTLHTYSVELKPAIHNAEWDKDSAWKHEEDSNFKHPLIAWVIRSYLLRPASIKGHRSFSSIHHPTSLLNGLYWPSKLRLMILKTL